MPQSAATLSRNETFTDEWGNGETSTCWIIPTSLIRSHKPGSPSTLAESFSGRYRRKAAQVRGLFRVISTYRFGWIS